MSITNLHSYRTKYFADSVEWCSHPQNSNIVSCGTYQLDDKTPGAPGLQRRNGSVVVFNFTNDETKTYFEKLYEEETDGILDQKWLEALEVPLLATATSFGKVHVYSWEENRLKCLSSLHIIPKDPENIALALDWDKKREKIVVSDSKGCISLIDFTSSSISLLNRWTAHTFEAWTCNFHKNNTNTVLTGGDDSLCCIYDLRDVSKPMNSIKCHDAGVTALLTFENHPYIFCTGSYDEHLRVFDMRSPRQCIESINLGGGIWRLKSNPFAADTILCACMYHNFTICSLTFDKLGESKIQDTFNGDHKSICYGADWCPMQRSKDEYFFASCSFYDNLLTINSYKR